jgi:nonsense-mediated mRNA decay protein 3
MNLQEYLDVIVAKAVSVPDIVLVKKKYIRREGKRIWKLKHMDKEVEMRETKKGTQDYEKQYEEFLQDIEEDKDIRKKVIKIKDNEVVDDLLKKFGDINLRDDKNDSDIDIKLEELIDELNINDEPERKSSIDVIKDKESEELDKNKKQIGKRGRDGKQLDEK